MNKLVDRFGRRHSYLRVSVTDRCNLRCVYCMPMQGIKWRPKDELLTFEEIFRVVKVFAELGIDKVRITGGEPLVRVGIESLVKQLRSISAINTLAMTTNAVLLKDKAKALKESGLNSLNISLDSLRKERFKEITKRDDHDNVMAAIDEAISSGFAPLKLNVVVMSGINDDEILDFIEFTKERPINVRFIEYMPFKDNQWQAQRVISYREMKGLIEQNYKLMALYQEDSAVAKDFSVANHVGTVSFITSMTDSFCATCNRIRLTADGSIKSCLFYPAEVNIRDELRKGISDSILAKLIQDVVLLKPIGHPPMEELAAVENRAMIAIGG